MKTKLMLIAAVPLIAAAATPPSERQALSSAAPFIDKANSEWTHAIVTGDSDVLAAPYDEHGIFVGPDGSVSIGKASVRRMYASRPAAVKVLKASIKSDGRVAHDSNDVYEWGTARMTVQRGNILKETSGRYLTVWHHVGNSWLITRNIAF